MPWPAAKATGNAQAKASAIKVLFMSVSCHE
jgi:hypothetical protein